jgi:hypothetical protein
MIFLSIFVLGYIYHFFLSVLGFELRALRLLGVFSIAWAMPPDLFALLIMG